MENEEQLLEVDEAGLESAVSSLDRTLGGISQGEINNATEAQTTQTLLAEQEDPRNKQDWGLAGVTKEVQSALAGGLQDTASSLATFPERVVDMFSGEMAAENKTEQGYRPDWSPFTDYDNPIETKTWWGQLIRGTVHFGSMAAGVIAAVKASPITIPAAVTSMTGYSLVRAAGIGAVSDLISKESDNQNVLGVMRDRYGWMDTPLSTKILIIH